MFAQCLYTIDYIDCIPFQTLFTCLSFRYVGCIGHGKGFWETADGAKKKQYQLYGSYDNL